MLRTDLRVRSLFVRGYDGIFRMFPLYWSGILFSSSLTLSEKVSVLLRGKFPQRILELISSLNESSWANIDFRVKPFRISVSISPKHPVPTMRNLGEDYGGCIVFVFVTHNTPRVVLIADQMAFGDCEVLDFFI